MRPQVLSADNAVEAAPAGEVPAGKLAVCGGDQLGAPAQVLGVRVDRIVAVVAGAAAPGAVPVGVGADG